MRLKGTAIAPWTPWGFGFVGITVVKFSQHVTAEASNELCQRRPEQSKCTTGNLKLHLQSRDEANETADAKELN
jgi:hypothetical protein